jgi:hypothetical protein
MMSVQRSVAQISFKLFRADMLLLFYSKIMGCIFGFDVESCGCIYAVMTDCW